MHNLSYVDTNTQQGHVAIHSLDTVPWHKVSELKVIEREERRGGERERVVCVCVCVPTPKLWS